MLRVNVITNFFGWKYDWQPITRSNYKLPIMGRSKVVGIEVVIKPFIKPFTDIENHFFQIWILPYTMHKAKDFS